MTNLVAAATLPLPMPCPFCGCSNADGMVGWTTSLSISGGHRYYFRCFGCGALGPDAHTQPEALEAWNRRKGP